MGDVLKFTGVTRLSVDPDGVLEGAMGQLSDVVLIGWGKEGELWFACSQKCTTAELLYLLESAKAELLR